MMAPYHENDPRTLAVLSSALRSSSRATRLRAVAMLASVACPQRDAWLAVALGDPDRGVRDTATIVRAWLTPCPELSCLPVREVMADGSAQADPDDEPERALPGACGYEWEYTVEVWRMDGLQLGSYFVRTCQEDDRHARSIALGQAILANVGTRGDAFDPELAATFIVEKSRRPRGPTRV